MRLCHLGGTTPQSDLPSPAGPSEASERGTTHPKELGLVARKTGVLEGGRGTIWKPLNDWESHAR